MVCTGVAKRLNLFWKSYWLALLRAGRDKRASVAVLKISLLLLYVVGCALYLVYTAVAGGPWQTAFYAFIFGTGILAAILMRRWHRKEDEFLNQSLTGQSNRSFAGSLNPPEAVRAYLGERTLIIASLLARGASEIHVHRNQNQNSSEILTRQALNMFLREEELWEKLELAEADLASAADGRWSSEQEGYVVVWCEQLRLLRWVLGITPRLFPCGIAQPWNSDCPGTYSRTEPPCAPASQKSAPGICACRGTSQRITWLV